MTDPTQSTGMRPDGQRGCPKCQPAQTLGIVTAATPGGHVDVEVCGGCRGVWTDWGEISELRKLAEIIGRADRVVNIPGSGGQASVQRDQQPGRCPACIPAPWMTRLLVGAFHIDRCDECLGLWFDGGELGPILTERGFEALMKALRAAPA